MSTAESDRGICERRKRAERDVWLIPAIAMVAIVAMTWLLKAPVSQLLAGTTIQRWDTTVLEWFRSGATPSLDRIVLSVTLLASPLAMTVYAFLGLSVLTNKRRWLLLYSWDALFLGMLLLTKTVKPIIQRARPTGAEAFLASMSYSFPSTHAFTAVAGFGMIAFVLPEITGMTRELRILTWLISVILMVVIGATRLYLGVHYLSDVVAGFLLGAAWLGVCLFSYNRSKVRLQLLTKIPAT